MTTRPRGFGRFLVGTPPSSPSGGRFPLMLTLTSGMVIVVLSIVNWPADENRVSLYLWVGGLTLLMLVAVRLQWLRRRRVGQK